MQGKVKFFSKRKGYGFIVGEDGKDYFVHHTGIQMEGFKYLEADNEVSFDTSETEKGTVAVNVLINK